MEAPAVSLGGYCCCLPKPAWRPVAEEDDRMSKSGMSGLKIGESDREWLVEGVNESGSL